MSGENPTPQQPEMNPSDVEAALNAANAGAGSDAAPAADAGAASGSLSPEQLEAALAASGAGEDAGNGLSQAEVDAALGAAGAGSSPAVDSTGRTFDDAAAMMAAAIAEERAAAAAQPGAVPAMPLDLPNFDATSNGGSDHGIGLLSDVELDVKIELGRASMLIEEVLRLGEGSVVELDKLAGDPVDVFVNGRLVARGEVLVLNENFCVRISEILPGGGEAEAA